MNELQQVLTTTFVIGLFAAGIRLAIPIFLAALGEIITERGGVLNLGLEGIMLVGAFAGFAAAFYAQESLPAGAQWLAPWLGLAAGTVAGMLMGLLMAVLAVTLQTDQVIAGIELVGDGLVVKTMTVDEVGGDRTVTTFTEVNTARRFSDAELKELFKVAR